MRVASFLISFFIAGFVVVILSIPLGTVPPIGALLSPQHGFWQNAEPVDFDFSDEIVYDKLNENVTVYFDERLVPHVFAKEDSDAFFAQGYLHARFRLWQMEFQTFAAAGRLTEILGAGPDSAYLANDRKMRRLGMVYGALNSLDMMEKDLETKSRMDAYTAGVNLYITNLSQSQLPLEYRLLNYRPEKWNNLKTALFLKYMSYDLTGNESDIEYTNAKNFFSAEDFAKLYPLVQDSLEPVVTKGTPFLPASVKPQTPVGAESDYYQWKDSTFLYTTSKPERSNGSNNWAVSGSRTRSGKPILCNDPHLGLNLPSLWYEMQISTPGYNVYGVSFPGSPALIIGFNDSIAWGVTNAARDVKDYYRIQFRDESRQEYMYDGNWKKADLRPEVYYMKDGSAFKDTVAYTVFGPVMFDETYAVDWAAATSSGLAVRWKAHDASNELKTFFLLNRARNYAEYKNAISEFVCPGQNFVFASKSGDIALWHQGAFPAKWWRQGDFVMPGTDNRYTWQATIPFTENPNQLNPPRGFVSSANQMPADTTYPYYLGGQYDVYRGKIINRYLDQTKDATIADMQSLQTNNYNLFAETAVPFLLRHLPTNNLEAQESRYLEVLTSWDKFNNNDEAGPVVFTVWFDMIEQMVWNDEFSLVKGAWEKPQSYTLIDAMIQDSAFSFIDNIQTLRRESLAELLLESFKKASVRLSEIEKKGSLNWSKFKNASVRHLLRLKPLSSTKLHTGGGVHIINATKQYHGPSWRMIVELGEETEAYGIYPGGQSGNPGSRFYDHFVSDWTKNMYYKLWVMKAEEAIGERVKHRIRFLRH